MATRLKDVKKIRDAFHRRSQVSLEREVNRQIKRVFVSTLELIEIKFGTDFAGYEELRAKILRTGNDSIRYVGDLLNKSYNVQKVPDVTIVNVANQRQEEEVSE